MLRVFAPLSRSASIIVLSKKADPAALATGSAETIELKSDSALLELQQRVDPDIMPSVVVGDSGTTRGLATVEVRQIPVDPTAHA
jgi:hypothetical protein